MTPICALSELPDGGSRGFSLGEFPQALEFFVVRRGSRVLAYRNSCPHTGVGLEWQPDRFLDTEGTFIQCHTHGALFRIEDGLCIAGPCLGQSLRPLAVASRDGTVYLAEPVCAGPD